MNEHGVTLFVAARRTGKVSSELSNDEMVFGVFDDDKPCHEPYLGYDTLAISLSAHTIHFPLPRREYPNPPSCLCCHNHTVFTAKDVSEFPPQTPGSKGNKRVYVVATPRQTLTHLSQGLV
jgi:hypothetical protein